MPPILAQPEAVQQNLSELRPLTNGDSVFSMAGGNALMDEAIAAIGAKDYAVAVERLQSARQVFNQLSNFHLDLANGFQGIDNGIYNVEKKLALDAGTMRDTATYRLALVHRAQEKPELAVPLLIQVVRSQSPVSDLGGKSYQQLYEIGFVPSVFPKSAEVTAPNTNELSILSMTGGKGLMDQAIAAITNKDYDTAVQRLQDARQVFNQLSNFHLDLANSFQGIDLDIYDVERKLALDAGTMRDTATYRLALAHRAQNKPELAVPLLIQVIKSQNPTSDLGKKSYQQLYELGFAPSEFKR
jgi:thioredoxin-like negative regulator of GroEL